MFQRDAPGTTYGASSDAVVGYLSATSHAMILSYERRLVTFVPYSVGDDSRSTRSKALVFIPATDFGSNGVFNGANSRIVDLVRVKDELKANLGLGT